MKEIWRAVVGWKGFYEVSDRGRVRSVRRVVTRSNGRRLTVLAKILSAPPNSDGYPHVTLHRPGKTVSAKVHILMARAFLGKCPNGKEVRHLNGTPTDGRLTNIAYGTPGENGVDKIAHGRSTRGHKNPKAKLTSVQVNAIRRRHFRNGVAQYDLAREYGVAPSTISGIVNRLSWGWL